MCGHMGFVTGNTRNHDASKFISDAFVSGSLRGMDSSGIAVIDTVTSTLEVHKLPINGTMFLTDRVAQRLIREAQESNKIAMCHTRHATVGKVDLSSAHPFEIEGQCEPGEIPRMMVGAHNGTLTGWKSEKSAKHYDVDSEWALNYIFDYGVEAFEDFRGAYCFVWWDSDNPDILNMALNDQRPMHIVFTEKDGMAYASEAGMLYWLCERNGIKMESKVIRLQAGYHYTFDVTELSKYSKEKLPEPAKAVYTPITHTTRNTYQTAMDKVDALLTKIKGGTLTLVSNQTQPTLTRAEFEAARDLHLNGVRGVFTPSHMDNKVNELYGSFEMAGQEWSAVIRGASEIKWDTNTGWDLPIIGVVDDGTNLVAVLPRPMPTQENVKQAGSAQATA